jgi:hypothetical protein
VLMLSWTAIASAGMSISGCGRLSEARTVQICYGDFESITYTGITRASIHHSCVKLEKLSVNDWRYRRIMSLVAEGEPATFDDAVTRVKITRPSMPDVFIDQNGAVSVAGRETRMNRIAFNGVKRLIEPMSRREYREWEKRTSAQERKAVAQGAGVYKAVAPPGL